MCTANVNVGGDSDDEDVWADSSDDGRPDAGRSDLDREATSRHQKFYNAGYRQGLDEGKEKTLQEGFNIGFKQGAAAGFEWGLLRGALRTLTALDGQAAGTRNLHTQIQALQAAAEVPPRTAMLGILHQILSQPISPSSPPTAATGSGAQVPRSSDAACAPDYSVDPHDPATSSSSITLQSVMDDDGLPAALSAMLAVSGSQTAGDASVGASGHHQLAGETAAAGEGAVGAGVGGGRAVAGVAAGVDSSGCSHAAAGAAGATDGGGGTSDGPPATPLPPAVSQPPGPPGLPDMRQLMGGLQRDLEALGFPLGQEPLCGAMGGRGSGGS